MSTGKGITTLISLVAVAAGAWAAGEHAAGEGTEISAGPPAVSGTALSQLRGLPVKAQEPMEGYDAAERIVLALTMRSARAAVAPGTLVPAEPTWDLITDLVRRGWPKSWIAREAGLGSSLQLKRDQVTARNAARITDLHARLDGITVPRRRHGAPLPALAEITADLTASA